MLQDTTYTKGEVDSLVEAIDSKIEGIDLSAYETIAGAASKYQTKADSYNKEYIDTIVSTVNTKLNSKLPIDSFNEWSETVATKEYVDGAVAGVDVSEQLKEYAKKSDLPEEYDDTAVKGRLDALESIDHSKYITDVSGKVDKESGKGLSTNDYTDADKAKLAATPLFWVGTESEYNALPTKDNNTFYYIVEE